ncbi:hypothetical protein GGX14DRAFT_565025 [Mycena pura]|uniref:Uncharacterized protein n=1 Tax=Mycena pura TaxID=153505 RepID=A0AAD6YC73_9AGAR|nr:hypothetical protein GGX14DRAFT_565025 [Mycena pura]
MNGGVWRRNVTGSLHVAPSAPSSRAPVFMYVSAASLTSSHPSDFPTDARRTPPKVDTATDSASKFYILGALLFLGALFGVVLLWARWRSPRPRGSHGRPAPTLPPRPRLSDVCVADGGAVCVWADMHPLALSPLPTQPPLRIPAKAGFGAPFIMPSPPSVRLRVAVLVAMPHPVPRAAADLCLDIATLDVDMEGGAPALTGHYAT